MRLFLTRKDIQLIKGCSENTAYKIYNTVKDSLEKKKHQGITIKEYCEYEGLAVEEVARVIRDLS